MPYSDDRFRSNFAHLLMSNFYTAALDIGAGAGKWGTMCRSLEIPVDAIEVFEPYIDRFSLKDIYRKIYILDILEVTKETLIGHDVFIMGDILEHLTVESAKILLIFLEAFGDIIIQIPYNYVQEAVYGNEHEKHEQPDLTHALFMNRYKKNRPIGIARDNVMGLYFIQHKV